MFIKQLASVICSRNGTTRLHCMLSFLYKINKHYKINCRVHAQVSYTAKQGEVISAGHKSVEKYFHAAIDNSHKVDLKIQHQDCLNKDHN